MTSTTDELRRVSQGPRAGEAPGGLGLVAIEVVAPGGAGQFITRCRDVLAAVLPLDAEQLAKQAERPTVVPGWFVEACAAKRSAEEEETWLTWWRGLEPEEKTKAEAERPWTLADWLEWLDPDDRSWYWWDAVATNDREVLVQAEIPDWPTPLGALEWLLRAAGAAHLKIDEPD